MGLDIKVRLMQLGKKQNDLVAELRRAGYRISPTELSNFLSGAVQTPKADRALEDSNKILKIWEEK